MSPEFETKVIKLIKAGEGSIPHLYLDTVGKVTVGVGNMLPDAASAQKLPFIHADDKRPATDDEISAEYALISAQEKGMVASNYKQFTTLVLTEEAIDKLLITRIRKFVKQLRLDFPDYDSYPEKARLGLIDMAFNLGNKGLVKKFPTFSRAARGNDRAACASECKRKGIGDARNDEIKHLFLDCIS